MKVPKAINAMMYQDQKITLVYNSEIKDVTWSKDRYIYYDKTNNCIKDQDEKIYQDGRIGLFLSEDWEIWKEPKKPIKHRVKFIAELLRSGWKFNDERAFTVAHLSLTQSIPTFSLSNLTGKCSHNNKYMEDFCGQEIPFDDCIKDKDGDIFWNDFYWSKEMIIEI